MATRVIRDEMVMAIDEKARRKPVSNIHRMIEVL